MKAQIGTRADNADLRDRAQRLLTEVTDIQKACTKEIKDYHYIPVREDQVKDKQEKMRAFKETIEKSLK